MCLTTVTKTYDKPFTPKNNIGYVAIEKTKNGLYRSELKLRRQLYEKRKWYQSEGAASGWLYDYEPAFHIFISQKIAKMWANNGSIVVKVKFKNMVAKGTQGGGRVIVARDRMIISEVKS